MMQYLNRNPLRIICYRDTEIKKTEGGCSYGFLLCLVLTIITVSSVSAFYLIEYNHGHDFTQTKIGFVIFVLAYLPVLPATLYVNKLMPFLDKRIREDI